MAMYVSDTFNLSMLDRRQQTLHPQYGGIMGRGVLYPRIPCPILLWEARERLLHAERNGTRITSAVKNPRMARLFAELLGREIICDRWSEVQLMPHDMLIVGQQVRMATRKKPEMHTIEWWVL